MLSISLSPSIPTTGPPVMSHVRCARFRSPRLFAIGAIVIASVGIADESGARAGELERFSEFVQANCVDCHSGPDAERGYEIDRLVESWSAGDPPEAVVEALEKALLRIRSRQMPPPDAGQPDESEFDSAVTSMVAVLNRHAEAHPYAGTTEALRRMTRTEYKNAIRDLLAVEIDVTAILPPDSSSDGFDNITVGDLSPLLIDRYLTSATRISRLAVGSTVDKPGGVTVRLPADQSQESHVNGLPLGTRGGTVIAHQFPRSGIYEIQVRLMRDRDERVEGMGEDQLLDLLIDRERRHRFELEAIRGGKDHSTYDANLNARIRVEAGAHRVGVTFVEKASPLQEIKRQPFDASYNRHRHPRRTPAIHEVSIIGPLESENRQTVNDDSESRRAIFIARPGDGLDEQQAAKQIFTHLMRRAYRRPVQPDDLVVPMDFFQRVWDATQPDGGRSSTPRFEAAIESGLTSILVNPNFLFRSERQPADLPPGTLYDLSPIEIASRLSFFLWSSLPDETLLNAADEGRLHDSDVIDTQVRRMLADPRSRSLVDSFADQWLYLRNLPTITPDLRRFPSFDNNLRESFAGETQHLFEDVMRRDASVLELISCDHTFLNERLAKHYGIPGIVGSHFRRVDVLPEWHRGGLLRHGSVLMATSYATRTSPTIRGAWVLENILGTPPPPPPPNVPTIKEKSAGEMLSFRDQLAKHREDAGCASCHDLIDPVGFALDRYDAVGRWRSHIEGQPVDSEGRLPDGTDVDGVAELERAIIARPELFVSALTEKLMTYALGRPITHRDGPTIRQVVRDAAEHDYRFSDLVSGIARSTPFLMRTSQ